MSRSRPFRAALTLTVGLGVSALPACSGSGAQTQPSERLTTTRAPEASELPSDTMATPAPVPTAPVATLPFDTVPPQPEVTAPPLGAGTTDVPFPALPDDGVVRAIRTPTGVVLPVIAEAAEGGWLVVDPCGAQVLVEDGVETISRAHVVLDAGHGGHDPGAVGPRGVTEADVNLAVAKAVERRLADAGAEVVMARTGNHTMNLETRVRLVNGLGPTAFVSVHHNGGRPAVSASPVPMVIHQAANPESVTLATALVRELESLLDDEVLRRRLEIGVREAERSAWATAELSRQAAELLARAEQIRANAGGNASTPSQDTATTLSTTSTPSTTAATRDTSVPASTAPATTAPAPGAGPALPATVAAPLLADLAELSNRSAVLARRAELWEASGRAALDTGIAATEGLAPPESSDDPAGPGRSALESAVGSTASVRSSAAAIAQIATSVASGAGLELVAPAPLPPDSELAPGVGGLAGPLALPSELDELDERRWFGARLGGPQSFTRDGGIDTLYLLRQSPTKPTIMTETLYLTNRDEEELLEDPAFIERQADAIARTIIAYVSDPATPRGTVDESTFIRSRADNGCRRPDLGVSPTPVRPAPGTRGIPPWEHLRPGPSEGEEPVSITDDEV